MVISNACTSSESQLQELLSNCTAVNLNRIKRALTTSQTYSAESQRPLREFIENQNNSTKTCDRTTSLRNATRIPRYPTDSQAQTEAAADILTEAGDIDNFLTKAVRSQSKSCRDRNIKVRAHAIKTCNIALEILESYRSDLSKVPKDSGSLQSSLKQVPPTLRNVALACSAALDTLYEIKISDSESLEIEKRHSNLVVKLVDIEMFDTALAELHILKTRLQQIVYGSKASKGGAAHLERGSRTDGVLALLSFTVPAQRPCPTVVNLVVSCQMMAMKIITKTPTDLIAQNITPALCSLLVSDSGPRPWYSMLQEHLSVQRAQFFTKALLSYSAYTATEDTLIVRVTAINLLPKDDEQTPTLLLSTISDYNHKSRLESAQKFTRCSLEVENLTHRHSSLSTNIKYIDIARLLSSMAKDAAFITDAIQWNKKARELAKTAGGDPSTVLTLISTLDLLLDSSNNALDIEEAIKEVPLPRLSRSSVEKIIRQLELLRRTCLKFLESSAKESAERVIIYIAEIYYHYKSHHESELFAKFCPVALDNCIAISRSIALQDFMGVRSILNHCQEVAELLNDHKRSIYIANSFYNHGIRLWNDRCRDEALDAWKLAVEIHSLRVERLDLENFYKKLERLITAHLETGQTEPLASVFIDALKATDKVGLLCEIADVAKVHPVEYINEQFPYAGKLVSLYARFMLESPSSKEVMRAYICELSQSVAAVLREWVVCNLLTSKRSGISDDIKRMMRSNMEVYKDSPVQYARTVILLLKSALHFDDGQSLVCTGKETISLLEADLRQTVVASCYTKETLAACCLYTAILEYRHCTLDVTLLQRSLELWIEVLAENRQANPRQKNLSQYKRDICQKLELLRELTALHGLTEMETVVLQSMCKLTTDLKQLLMYYTRLSRLYLRMGYSGKSGLHLATAHSLLKQANNAENQSYWYAIAEVNYLLSIGNSERARLSYSALESQFKPLLRTKDHNDEFLAMSASACLAASQVSMSRGLNDFSVRYAKAAVRILSRLHERQTRHQDISSASKTASRSVNNTRSWSSMAMLLISYLQLSIVYDHMGLVRETEFYLQESITLAKSIGSDSSITYCQSLLGDFYTRSENLMKGESLLFPTNDYSLCKTACHKDHVLLCMYLALYFQRKQVFEDEKHQFTEAEKYLDNLITGSSVKRSEVYELTKSLTKLKLDSSKATKTPKLSSSECTPLTSLKGHILRSKATSIARHESLEKAEEVLKESENYSHLARDAILQNMREAQHQLLTATTIFKSDPVFGVLEDSVLSLPNILTSHCSSSQPQISQISSPAWASMPDQETRSTELVADSILYVASAHKAGPIKPILGCSSHSTSKKSATANRKKPPVQKAVTALTAAKNLILAVYTQAATICSAFEVRTMCDIVVEAMLLLSAISGCREDLQSISIAYFMEQGRGASLIKDTLCSKEEIQAWPCMADDYSRTDLQDIHCFQKDYIDTIPPSWVVVSIGLFELTGDLVITKYQSKEAPFILRLPLTRNPSKNDDGDESVFLYKDGLVELQEIISKSNESSQLSKHLQNANRAEKQAWWKERRCLDERLHTLLENIEYCWIGGFRGIFSDTVINKELLAKFSVSFFQLLEKHLPSRKTVRTRSKKRQGIEIKIDPRVLKLFIGLGDPRQTDNSELLEDLIYYVLDILQFHGENNAYDELDIDAMVVEVQEILRMYYELSEDQAFRHDHFVLVLDKSTHAFPWESLPCLRGLSISRVPSLSILKKMLADRPDCLVKKDNGAFLLNPSVDLKNTEERFAEKLMSLPGWVGKIGSPYSEIEFRSHLAQRDVFLYFGHGGGEQYIRGSQVKSLEACATTLLMGCSSGALHNAGDFEPWGTPMNYLVGNCPALVANLWDVTDKDIDKLSERLFLEWGIYPSTTDRGSVTDVSAHHNLATSLAMAREECNLKYLNGAAPVLYGLPVRLKNKY
ncbi:peptidase family C50-domain-containing protein [Dipodascopsis tothii]|uniref:peptidase family C50-domain-containing protein n=1 Tax=Dipodascopsis tothii TaxID=44089 RepID=UPI0034CEE858